MQHSKFSYLPWLLGAVTVFISLLADTPDNLQKLINIVQNWCKKWRLIVNPQKSKVVHFRNAPKQRTDFIFKLGENGNILDTVDSYKYLGVCMDEYLTYKKATEVLSTAAGRALGSMITKYKHMKEMSYKTYTTLYESMVCSVMDYSAAIWGTKNFDCMNGVHKRAMRFFTGVHRLTPIPGYTGDMGWPSTNIRWKLEAVRLWNRLIGIDNDRLVKKVLLWDLSFHETSNKSNFSSHVKQICCEAGTKVCFTNRDRLNLDTIKNALLEKMGRDWLTSIQNMKKLDVYKCVKINFGVEKYLLLNLSKYEKALLSQLRYGVLPLRVETGRFVGESHENRICTLCDLNCVENTMHFLFQCPLYTNNRNELYNRAKLVLPEWNNLTEVEKLCKLFTELPRSLGRYVKHSFLLRRQTLFK